MMWIKFFESYVMTSSRACGSGPEFYANCRELAADRKLASKHAQLYRIMQASLPVPNPSRSKLTLPSFSRALPGPPSTAMSAAEKDTGALLQDIGSSQKYSVLHSLLHGRRPETVVGAICALATLLQPAVASC